MEKPPKPQSKAEAVPKVEPEQAKKEAQSPEELLRVGIITAKEKESLEDLAARRVARKEAVKSAVLESRIKEVERLKNEQEIKNVSVESVKPLTKEEKEARTSERLGIEKSLELKSLIGKGLVDTLGSVFGARSAWEVPKAVLGYFKKKEQRGKISEATVSLFESVQARKKLEKIPAEELAKPIKLKIKELNERLKDVKMPAKEKSGLRKEMAEILKEYRQADRSLEEAKTEKIGNLLDLYVNNSAQTMIAAREALNTVSIMAMMPWLRGVGYTALAGVERAVKASDNYEKEHFKEKEKTGKLGFLAKSLTVDAAKETYNGLIGNFFNKEKSKVQTGAEFATSIFGLMRLAGVAEFEAQLQSGAMTMQEGAQKFWGSLEEGDFSEALKQGGENWKTNAERLLSYVGLSENPERAMQKLIAEREAGEVKAPEEKIKEILEGREKIKELATIRRGEGITHSFLRQLENDPDTYGFKGDANNQLEVHRWAQRQAYALAVKNGFISPPSGEEVRVYWDAKNPSSYLLKPDLSVEVLNKHEYRWNSQEQIKAEIERAQKAWMQIEGIYKYKWGPFSGSQIEEWGTVKDLKASDILEGKFGVPVGSGLDAAEAHNRKEMQEFLEELQKTKHLNPKPGETVEEFIRRSNNVRSLDVRITEAPAAQPQVGASESAHAKSEASVSKLSEKIPTLKIEGTKVFSGADGSKIVFEYDATGNIARMKPLGDYNFSQRSKLLVNNWRDILPEMLVKKNISLGNFLRDSKLDLNVRGILQMKKVLDELVRDGAGNSKEAEHLRHYLKDYEGIFKK